MEQIPAFADRLGVIGMALAVAFAVYKDWLVTGGRHREIIGLYKDRIDLEVRKSEKLEAQLAKAVEAQVVANETIARTASMVPDLVAQIARLGGETHHE